MPVGEEDRRRAAAVETLSLAEPIAASEGGEDETEEKGLSKAERGAQRRNAQ